MEDESDEWMTEEYSSPSLKENNTSRLRWIWDKGFGIGKKVALTGAVISSAPIILPPLVVISALGFAVSVPLGFVYASYAVSQKLMSKLLPSQVDFSEEESADFEGKYNLEEEEKEQMEDFRKGVEARINFDDLGSEDFGVDDEFDNVVDDYENTSPVKEDRQEEEEEILADEEGKDEVAVVEVTHVVVIEDRYDVMGDEEDEEIIRESTGLLEKIRDGGEIDDGVKDDNAIDDKNLFLENLDYEEPSKGIEEDVEKEANTVDSGEIETGRVSQDPVDDKDMFMDKAEPSESVEGTDKENISDEIGSKDETMNLEKRSISEVSEDQESEKIPEGKKLKLEENNGKFKEKGDLKSEQKRKRRGKKRGKACLDEKKVNEESIEGKQADYKYNVDGLSSEEKEIAIHEIDNAREATKEKESSTSDVTGAKGVPYSEKTRQDDNDEDSKSKEIADSLDLPVSKGVGHEYTETAPPSNQVLLTEDSLWQQIDGLRTIVGYKAVQDKTLIRELKALYIFTGVEPPSSFNDPHDLIQVDEKLRFLMSVVGVK